MVFHHIRILILKMMIVVIRENNSLYSNPINATDDNGELLDFIEYQKTIIKKINNKLQNKLQL